ncbi:MAG: NEL-type E3 ubiquitin ligase domain-containing protein [Rhabdochlamydiaceae bacterium]
MSINRIEQTLLSYLPYQRIIGVLGFALLILTAYRNRTTMGSLFGRVTTPPAPELKKLEYKAEGTLYYSQLDDLITQVKQGKYDELILVGCCLTLKQVKYLFEKLPNLKGFGIQAQHLQSKEELEEYLNLFAPNGTPVLRALHLTEKTGDLHPDKLPKSLYYLYLESPNVYVNDLEFLETLITPYSPKIQINNCPKLCFISFPKSVSLQMVYIENCPLLKSLVCDAESFCSIKNCKSLTSLELPFVKKCLVGACQSLTTVKLPMAIEATFGNCPNLDIDIQYLPMIKELILTAMNLGTVNSLPGEDIALIECQLTSLRLDNAEDVTIHKCNQLTSVDLPSATTVNISDCSALQTVNLPYARQANFYRLPNLRRLDSTHVPTIIRLGFKTTQRETNFAHEPVLQLPEGLGSLSALESLKLSGANISGLPIELLQLPSTCTIDITGCPISTDVIQRLQRTVQSQGYQGPRISYSMPEAPRTEGLTIEQALQQLHQLAGSAYTPLQNIPGNGVDKATFEAWLSKLSYMADYKAKGDVQKGLACMLLKYIQLADKDPSFREVFGLNIEQAAGSCGDRVAYYLLFLDLESKLREIELTDIKQLHDLLVRAIWPMILLEHCAENKIPALQMFDEIEVYLGYPIMLRERLNLQINAKEMLYFACSALTKQDLDDAAAFVEKTVRDDDKRCAFLINQPKWIKALEARFPKEMAALLEARDENEDYVQGPKDYEAGLIALTKSVTIE